MSIMKVLEELFPCVDIHINSSVIFQEKKSHRLSIVFNESRKGETIGSKQPDLSEDKKL